MRIANALFVAAAILGLTALVAWRLSDVSLTIVTGLLAIAGFSIGVRARYLVTEIRIAMRRSLGERDLVADQLQQQRELVDTLAEGLDAALFTCDLRAVIQFANPTALELFELSRPEGQSLLAVTLSVELERIAVAARESDVAIHEEVTFTYPRERIGQVTAWRDPAKTRLFVSVYDVTDLRRLERSRRDFVANVSHELRTPMTIIRAYAETMLDENPPTRETTERMLPRIITEVDRLTTISQDLLVLSMAESNAVRKQTCDLAEVVRRVVAQLEPKAARKGLRLSFEGPEELVMQANPAQMGQVAINLIDNALNYTLSGSVDAKLELRGDEATLEVRDTGIGIAAEHQDRVFERFYRVDRGRSRSTGGTGLGLSIVRHIVEAHGGRMEVESVLNRGSTFRAFMPIA